MCNHAFPGYMHMRALGKDFDCAATFCGDITYLSTLHPIAILNSYTILLQFVL